LYHQPAGLLHEGRMIREGREGRMIREGREGREAG
jgi:hypothetical protein